MKKLMNACALFAVLGMAGGTAAWAHHHKNPCAAVYKACKEAGKKGKQAHACVKTIKGGGTVEGVTVSPSDVQACQGGAQSPAAPTGGNG